MKKIVVVSDSFKGSITSSEICSIIAEEVGHMFPSCEVCGIPIADGGEGTVDCFLEGLGGEKVFTEVSGPNFERITAYYGRFGETAIIEMASAAGLPLAENKKDPTKTTTFGVGELMRHALEHGARKIVLGLGGSSTNDAGCGAACAMGTRFLDAAGEEFIPVGGTLSRIVRIDNMATYKLLEGISVIAMCDIDNIMHGTNGAAYIFAPQKGADVHMVRFLDEQLVSLDDTIAREMGEKVANIPGAGAAGAMGAGVMAFFRAVLRPGIETVLDTVSFEERVVDADMVITGEGKLDTQSLRGKVVIGVARRAKNIGIPVVAVVGDVGENITEAYNQGITAIFSTNHLAIPFSEAKKRSKEDYRFSIVNLLNLIKVCELIS
jgi:glycerate kinase